MEPNRKRWPTSPCHKGGARDRHVYFRGNLLTCAGAPLTAAPVFSIRAAFPEERFALTVDGPSQSKLRHGLSRGPLEPGAAFRIFFHTPLTTATLRDSTMKTPLMKTSCLVARLMMGVTCTVSPMPTASMN